jgi:hypothetical protein
MKLSKVIWNAKKKGIVNAPNLTKPELIRAIQIKEGNTPCFGTGVGNCARYACLWWEDCWTLRYGNVAEPKKK